MLALRNLLYALSAKMSACILAFVNKTRLEEQHVLLVSVWLVRLKTCT